MHSEGHKGGCDSYTDCVSIQCSIEDVRTYESSSTPDMTLIDLLSLLTICQKETIAANTVTQVSRRIACREHARQMPVLYTRTFSTHVFQARFPHTFSTHVFHTRFPHTFSTHVFHTRFPRTFSTAVGQLGGWQLGGWQLVSWQLGGWQLVSWPVGRLAVGQFGGWQLVSLPVGRLGGWRLTLKKK